MDFSLNSTFTILADDTFVKDSSQTNMIKSTVFKLNSETDTQFFDTKINF